MVRYICEGEFDKEHTVEVNRLKIAPICLQAFSSYNSLLKTSLKTLNFPTGWTRSFSGRLMSKQNCIPIALLPFYLQLLVPNKAAIS